jgi:hypothetical protein
MVLSCLCLSFYFPPPHKPAYWDDIVKFFVMLSIILHMSIYIHPFYFVLEDITEKLVVK